jgi:hypothetical protein
MGWYFNITISRQNSTSTKVCCPSRLFFSTYCGSKFQGSYRWSNKAAEIITSLTPSYSPSDYHMFGQRNKPLHGRFAGDDEV